MTPAPRLASARFSRLNEYVSRLVDCWQEARNNHTRGEWTLAEEHLRKLFDNADAISRHRKTTMREVRRVRRKKIEKEGHS